MSFSSRFSFEVQTVAGEKSRIIRFTGTSVSLLRCFSPCSLRLYSYRVASPLTLFPLPGRDLLFSRLGDVRRCSACAPAGKCYRVQLIVTHGCEDAKAAAFLVECAWFAIEPDFRFFVQPLLAGRIGSWSTAHQRRRVIRARYIHGASSTPGYGFSCSHDLPVELRLGRRPTRGVVLFVDGTLAEPATHLWCRVGLGLRRGKVTAFLQHSVTQGSLGCCFSPHVSCSLKGVSYDTRSNMPQVLLRPHTHNMQLLTRPTADR